VARLLNAGSMDEGRFNGLRVSAVAAASADRCLTWLTSNKLFSNATVLKGSKEEGCTKGVCLIVKGSGPMDGKRSAILQ